jgi:hypothetical protein
MPITSPRLALGSFLTLFTLAVVSTTTACKGDGSAIDTDNAKAGAETVREPRNEADDPELTVQDSAAPAGAEPGTTGTTTGPAEVTPPPEPVDPVPALLETAKNLDTADDAAIKALDEAKAAGADKIDLAKLANTRGEALVSKSEPDRAEPFFEWAKDAHTLYAEPVFNLAKQACLTGDADLCKELLLEVKKRGNKKLLKNIGVDPIFTPVQDDAEIRKLYEK